MVKLVQCPECEGEGRTMDIYGGPNGPIERWEECNVCFGEGEIEGENE